MKRFSTSVAKQLRHYVYVLVDPSDKKIFYVGKAMGPNRPFVHLKEGIDHKNPELEKKISKIRGGGEEPEVEILRYGLSKRGALDMESAVIDAIGVGNLSNLIKGHRTMRAPALKINQQLGGKPLNWEDIRVCGMMIYSHQSQKQEYDIYDATRGNWAVSKKTREEREEEGKDGKEGKLKRRYAFAMDHSVILEVYEILMWFPGGTTVSSLPFNKEYHKGRAVWEFVGKKADEPELRRYRNRVLHRGSKRLHAAQRGIRYVN